MRGAARAALAVVPLALFPVLVVGLGAGCVLGGMLAGGSGVYLVVAGLVLVSVLGFALVRAARVRPVRPEGLRLHRHEHPALWREVDDLSARARTRPPDEIMLVRGCDAAVSEHARALGLRPGRRYLLLGLPLLAGLNVSELRSVFAHEIGHYGGGHTRFAAFRYRGGETLGRTASRLGSGPAYWVLIAHTRVYALLARPAARAQELRADAASVAAVGRAAAADALRATATMAAAWETFAQRYLALPSVAERTPDILLGFRAFLDHPHQRRLLADPEPHVLDATPRSPLDGHPTIRARLAAIERQPGTTARHDPRPAWTLLNDPEVVVPAAEERLLISGELGPRASWDEIVRRAGAADAERGAELLATTASESGAAPGGTLGEVLRAVNRGDAARLVAPLVAADATAEQRRQAEREGLASLLGDTIVAALVAKRLAHHELNWGGGWRVVGPGGELRPDELALPAVTHPALVPQFARYLTELGVPLTFVRPPGLRRERRLQASAAEPQLVSVAAEVSVFHRSWDVLIHDTGLLLAPIAPGRLLAQRVAGALGQSRRLQGRRLTALAELEWRDRFALPGVRWLAADAVLGGDHKKFLTGGGTVALRFGDGRTATLRTKLDRSYESLAEFVTVLPPHAG